MRTPLLVALLALAVGVRGQEPPAFDVASVKRNDSGSLTSHNGRVAGERFTATNATVVQLLRAAYAVQEFQIEGAPGWAGLDRFDIAARIPPGHRADGWPQMLQQLLAERFRLRLHREAREREVYVLVVAPGGLKVTPAATSRCEPPNDCGMSAAPTYIVARGQSMDQLATRLSRSIGQMVLNRTGVEGVFDYTVEWTQDDQFREAGASASPAIFTALTEQLGLRLRQERAAVDVLVVDSVERPTPD